MAETVEKTFVCPICELTRPMAEGRLAGAALAGEGDRGGSGRRVRGTRSAGRRC